MFVLDRAELVCERGTKRLMGVAKLDTVTLGLGDFAITFHIPKNAKADGHSVLAELGA
ncbi:MAG: hypothetical protein ACI8Y4_004374 [Candidatus Poriferisodalaceae bacterium]